MTDLRACPFCGGEAKIINEDDVLPFIRCKECDLETRSFLNEERLTSFWNKRTECQRCDRIELWVDNFGMTPNKLQRYEKILDLMRDGIRVLDSGLNIQPNSSLHHCINDLLSEEAE